MWIHVPECESKKHVVYERQTQNIKYGISPIVFGDLIYNQFETG